MKPKHLDNPYLREVITKMFEIAGYDPETVDISDEKWFNKYEWTEQQEEEFRKWLVQYLQKNSKARKVLLLHPNINKRYLERAVNWFILRFGLKTKSS